MLRTGPAPAVLFVIPHSEMRIPQLSEIVSALRSVAMALHSAFVLALRPRVLSPEFPLSPVWGRGQG